jgi:hypothetical protein
LSDNDAPPPAAEPEQAGERPPEGEPPAGVLPWGRIVLGVLLVVIGAAWTLDLADVVNVGGTTLFDIALLLVGLALVASARRGGHGGLIGAGIVLTVLLLVTSIVPVRVTGGIGERVAAPPTAERVEDSYELAIGSLTVDLRDVDLPDGETEVEVRVGIGELIVLVPDGVSVHVDGRVGAGEISALGRSAAGVGVELDERFPEPDATATLVVDARVGLGQIEVRR